MIETIYLLPPSDLALFLDSVERYEVRPVVLNPFTPDVMFAAAVVGGVYFVSAPGIENAGQGKN